MTAKGEIKPGYKQTAVGIIPEDWDEVRLGDVGNALIGLTYKPSDTRPHGTLVLRSSNIQDGQLRFDDNVYVDPEIAQSSMVEVGDLLICARNGSRELIGKSVRLDERAEGMAFGAFMAAFRSRHSEFLGYQFQSELIRRQINEHLGATINQITNKSLLSFKVPLPRDDEEKRAISQALIDADALIAALEEMIAKKRDLKQAAMQHLLTGKTRLPGFFGDWEVMRLGEVAAIRNRKINTLGADAAAFCVELEQVGQNTGQIDGHSDARSRRSAKYHFQKGDVLFGRLRPYLRKFWMADREGVCSTEIWPLIPICNRLVSGFLFQTVQTDAFIEAANSSYGTHMPRSDWKALTKFEVSLPLDPAEQTAIAEVLSDMDADLAALEAQASKARAVKQGMMQELLTGRVRLV